jgi:hypothetical protein
LSNSSTALLRDQPAAAALGRMLRLFSNLLLRLQIAGWKVMEMRVDHPRGRALPEHKPAGSVAAAVIAAAPARNRRREVCRQVGQSWCVFIRIPRAFT